ncbi:MAG: CoA transferase [Deltaproteobacteria bacterium]|nr:CoA transferase [Deltaproteobacteria bacterium]
MGPLSGIKVVEMGVFVAGPAAAAVLADWGADVVKIENPAGGDPIRALVSLGLAAIEPEVNVPLELENRNKRGVAVDVTRPEGREVVLRLLRGADVFLSNLRAGALERAGLAYADVKAVNPRIIYATLSGYGTRGPDKDRAAFDYAAFWARSGAMASLGEPGGTPPTQRPAMGDHSVGLQLAGAVSAALFHRERTGEGQAIHLSLFQAGLWMMASDIEIALATGNGYVPTGRIVPNPLWNHYQAKDGRWFHLVMIQADRFWARFCEAIGEPDLGKDERYDGVVRRGRHARELIERLDRIFATRTRDEWAAIFDRNEFIWAPVQTVLEASRDPQALALGFYETVPHRSGRDLPIVKSPVEFAATPAAIRRGAPELGEHTEEVLLEHGYGWDDIAHLREKGVFG